MSSRILNGTVFALGLSHKSLRGKGLRRLGLAPPPMGGLVIPISGNKNGGELSTRHVGW